VPVPVPMGRLIAPEVVDVIIIVDMVETCNILKNRFYIMCIYSMKKVVFFHF
jgi:hypothetical protein